MFKNIFILLLIVILAALGAAAALRIIFWSLRMLFHLAIVIAALIGVLYLLRKLRT